MTNLSTPASPRCRQVVAEGLLSCIAFLAAGFFVGTLLTKHWAAYERNVLPAEAQLAQAATHGKEQAVALADKYRLAMPQDQLVRELQTGAQGLGDEAVTAALSEISRLSLNHPLPEAFVLDAKRLMYVGQVESQLLKQQLVDGLARYDDEAPIFGRLMSQAYFVVVTSQ